MRFGWAWHRFRAKRHWQPWAIVSGSGHERGWGPGWVNRRTLLAALACGFLLGFQASAAARQPAPGGREFAAGRGNRGRGIFFAVLQLTPPPAVPIISLRLIFPRARPLEVFRMQQISINNE